MHRMKDGLVSRSTDDPPACRWSSGSRAGQWIRGRAAQRSGRASTGRGDELESHRQRTGMPSHLPPPNVTPPTPDKILTPHPHRPASRSLRRSKSQDWLNSNDKWRMRTYTPIFDRRAPTGGDSRRAPSAGGIPEAVAWPGSTPPAPVRRPLPAKWYVLRPPRYRATGPLANRLRPDPTPAQPIAQPPSLPASQDPPRILSECDVNAVTQMNLILGRMHPGKRHRSHV